MLKTRIYFLQFLGIIVLLCCYLLRDQPDRMSAMHFDSSTKSVIKIDHEDEIDYLAKEVTTSQSSSQHGNKHKSNRLKHTSCDLMLPIVHSTYVFEPKLLQSHSCTLPVSYSYLFYAEINPPPPKC